MISHGTQDTSICDTAQTPAYTLVAYKRNYCYHIWAPTESELELSALCWFNLTQISILIGRYEGCWAAMAKDASGIVFIYNPDQPSQEKDLESW